MRRLMSVWTLRESLMLIGFLAVVWLAIETVRRVT